MSKLAPVVIFVYARPEHTKAMLEALSNDRLAKDTEVWIYADNAKKEKAIPKVNEVRKYVHSVEQLGWFKELTIVEAENNKGLANSVIDGVSEIINRFGKVIVLEDDLVVSNNFLTYMNDALEFYKNDEKIWSISGYNLPIQIPEEYKHDIYLGYRGCSWGWATWKDRWTTVDWKVSDYKEFKNSYKKRKKFNKGGKDLSQMLDDQMTKKIDSWAIRWCYAQYKQNKYTVYPVNSLVSNIGLDGTGTHSGDRRDFDVRIENKNKYNFENIQPDKKILKLFRKKFDYGIKQSIKEIFSILNFEGIIKRYRKIKGKNNERVN